MKQFFWYEKYVCIFSKFLQYTIHWGKTQILKKFPSDKRNDKKNVLLFLSRVRTHHSFTFNMQSLDELKLKVRRSKRVCGIFYFKFHFIFIKAYIFVREKTGSLTLKRCNSFKIENNRKATHTHFLLDLWFLTFNKKFENSVISAWVGAPQKLTWRQIF